MKILTVLFLSSALGLLSSVLGLPSSLLASTNTYTDVTLGPSGTMTGAPHDLFRVSGNFNNASTNHLAFNLLTATVEFTGTGGHTLEQAGRNTGPCAGQISNNFAFGTLQLDGGTVTLVDNYANLGSPGAVYVQTLTGTGTLNVGDGLAFYFGATNAWLGTVNVTGSGIFRAYLPDNLDTDGDGSLNWQECACGTDPTNAVSVLRLISIIRTNVTDLRLTWKTVGGKSYVVQTNAPPATGSFTNNFTDFTPLITIPGIGESTTNYLDPGGATNRPTRYYRLRLVP